MEIKNIYKKEVEIFIGTQEGKKFFGEYWNSWEDSQLEKRIKKEVIYITLADEELHSFIQLGNKWVEICKENTNILYNHFMYNDKEGGKDND